MNESLLYQVDFTTSEFICGYCKKRFPTHYRVKKDFFTRRQFARRWVAGNNNFFRHVVACRERRINNEAISTPN